MAIVDTKDLELGPEFIWNWRLLLFGLNHVKNNRYSVFIRFSNDSYIRVRGKCFDHAKGLRADLTCLEEGQCAVRLVLLKQLCDSCFHAFRGHLCLCALALYNALGLLGHHCRLHNYCEGRSLP